MNQIVGIDLDDMSMFVSVNTGTRTFFSYKKIEPLDKDAVLHSIEEITKEYKIPQDKIIADRSTLRWLFL